MSVQNPAKTEYSLCIPYLSYIVMPVGAHDAVPNGESQSDHGTEAASVNPAQPRIAGSTCDETNPTYASELAGLFTYMAAASPTP